MNNRIEIENGEFFSVNLSDNNLFLRFLAGPRERIFDLNIKACYSITIELLDAFAGKYQQLIDLLLYSEVNIKLNSDIVPNAIELSDWEDDFSIQIPFRRFYCAFEELTMVDLRILLQRSFDLYESYFRDTQSKISCYHSNKAKIQKILDEELKRFELKSAFFNFIRFREGERRTKLGISLLNKIHSLLNEKD
ncbi:hypothetical protein V6Z05_14880 [Leptospira venezuelensis]|uniref:hypothetical protein n=1 Tax=Leptospira venezuelensis TaxID=1958811 RepID=UPI000A3C22B0|nr:hypothetical protein [Leptospira venezuelensis]